MRKAILVALVGVGCGSPTSPTPPTHPNEVLISNYTGCHTNHHNMRSLKVVFFEEGTATPNGGWVAGRAWPDGDHVEYWGPWVRGEKLGPKSPENLEALAAHEVCHASGIWNEAAADECAVKAMGKAECR